MGRTFSNNKSSLSSIQSVQRRRRNRWARMHVTWRDQEVEGMSLTIPSNSHSQISEYMDPAILDAKPAVFRYARDKLLDLRQVPLAQQRPVYLDVAHNNSNGVWDPELWHRCGSNRSNENGDVIHKRRSGDPRERIRKEDGIVLSPQRRSFNSGCFVSSKENQKLNRSHSPIGGKPDANMVHFREIPSGGRRIGSGRILSRDVPWDFQEKDGDEFSYRKERRDDREERFERRSYSRDYDMNKDKQGGRNNRFNERRRIDSHNEEPEWFSAGPASQHETIELRGFDDIDNDKTTKGKKQSTSKKRKERRTSEQNENKQPSLIETIAINDKKDVELLEVDQENNITSGEAMKTANEHADPNIFNLDDILKCETISGLLRNGNDGGGGDAGGSRFSQFFTRQSPVNQSDSRRSSLQDDHIIRNVLNDITEPNISIPDSDLYFAPISPAANTGAGVVGQNAHESLQKPLNILEMLQRGKQSNKEVPATKLVSLEELEARILQHGRNERIFNSKLPNKAENDTAAFERLVAQMKGGNLANNAPALAKASPLNMFERQQAQIDMMSKLMNANHSQVGALSMSEMVINQSRDLLNRPEAQAILQGLKRGDITPQHLYQQLAANPAMQPRHRELLLTILKLHAGGVGIGYSPRVLSPVPSHSMFQQQQQQHQLCISPLPTALHQRIPSPLELQQHTQAILHNALIKKRLEEQQENFKRRQEHHSSGRGVSPVKHTPSPTPLAFTPTSVLRKMTADKDDGGNKTPLQGRPVTGIKPNISQFQTWNLQQHSKQPAGRPIVKANPSLQAQQSHQQDLQQFYQQHRLYGQQQQPRKVSQQQYPSQSGAISSSQQSLHNHVHPQYQFSSNSQQFQQHHLTQHQLRAQHQQHQPSQTAQQQTQYGNKTNQQQNWSQQHHSMLTGHNFDNRSLHLMGDRGGGGASNNGGELSPVANQLARWFPPELLEKARAGKVPSMPNSSFAQHAVNLEEMERHTAPPIHN